MLIERILTNLPYEREGEPLAYQLVTPAVKYFTAPILNAFAKSDDSIVCQHYYLDALVGHLGDDIQLIKGHYDARPARAYRWESDKPPRECDRVEIWKLEEKRSDVALALHTYGDAIRNQVDQIVVLTNDSDFQPAMQMIRQHTPTIIGLIAPIRPGGGNVNAKLQKHAHWIRRHILDDEIARSQLPSAVQGPGRVVHKPLSWYPRPDLLIPIFEEAKRVRGSAGAARKWLNQPCSHLGNRIPIAMCEQDATAQELRQYMERYAQEFGLARIQSNNR
jgi:6-hydroxy-3-succinoylpyridine 3-monooxygenase